MRGLLIKDCLTLVKQMKIFLVLIIIFSIVPGYNMSAFAVIYSALLPMTALSYDERSKWDVLASMMPYKPRDMVLSKYLLGFCAVLAAVILSCIAQTAVAAVKHTAVDPGLFAGSVLMFCAGLITLSVLLPFMFKFGVEKGRIALFVIVGLAAVAAAFLSVNSDEGSSVFAAEGAASLPGAAGIAAAAAAVILAASILISVRIYSRKEF